MRTRSRTHLLEHSLVADGAARELRPIAQDEIYRTSREAPRNAFNHAKARRLHPRANPG